MSEKKTKKDEASPGFEKALERLEKLVGEMEGGKLTLEEMIARFEEGRGLVKFCTEKLNEVERRVEALVLKEDGSVDRVPFQEGAETESGDDAASESADRELF